MMLENEARIRLEIEDSNIICNALSVEGKRNIPRTNVDILCEGNNVEIIIRAMDFNALRAAINSYMRWINLTMEILEMV
ncbi:MAG: KEOPS complex subunit Pcc1 [Thermoplasmata archaeon]